MVVSWFSCGASSFIATYLMKDEIDKIIYTHIENQHPDTLRFLKDAEKIIGKEIEIISSPYFKSVEEVIESTGIINTVKGAPCTNILKKKVRKMWEAKNPGKHTYVWGFDNNEKDRAERLLETMPDYNHSFPLIEYGLSKKQVHALCTKLGIKRPAMYDLGYNNNNCIGCVKGGMGYWNKIRVDFPEVFERRAKLERKLNCTTINGIFLDELDPERGRNVKEIIPDCGVSCEYIL